MSKSINKTQSEILLNKMLSNPGIAKGYDKQNKKHFSTFWMELKDALNAAGPPTKSLFEWKKVWVDQKRYVRKKYARNAEMSNKSSNRYYKRVNLTAADEAILQLLGENEAIDKVDDAFENGLSSEYNEDDEADITQDSSWTGNSDEFQPYSTASSTSCSTIHRRTAGNPPKRRKNECITKTEKQEIQKQEKLCSILEEAVAEAKEDIKVNKPKKTKEEQLNLLKHRIGKFYYDGNVAKNKFAIRYFWRKCTEELNNLGPPTRTTQEWRKVWGDYKRYRARRKYIFKNKTNTIDHNGFLYSRDGDSDSDLILLDEITPPQELDDIDFRLKGGTTEDFGINNDHSIEPDNKECSTNLPIDSQEQQQELPTDEQNCIKLENSSLNYANYIGLPPPLQEAPKLQSEIENSIPSNPSEESSLLEHTLYTLQSQMDHQTKMLESMTRMSSSMAVLMERQVVAIERQSEAMWRQAEATERHTQVMNSLFGVLKQAIPKLQNNVNYKEKNW